MIKIAWLVFITLITATYGLIPIEIKGSRFVRPATKATDPGEEFIILGVDYQPGGSSSFNPSGSSDVLTDADACLRDAFVLQQLGVNTIRVYSVSPWLNHDACMSIFNSAGIYVILDVNNPYQALSRSDPASSYNKGYLNNVFGIIDAFKGYPNLLGFFSGNEVINDGGSAKATPQYIRAVQRDMKQYIKLHADRTIPVGYSAADDISLRLATWEYLQCGNDTSRSDFYGLNSYEWCSGQSDWQTSGYGSLESSFNSTTIPVFLSEYGCNTVSPRTFTEVNEGIYADLEEVFSGGLVYEYSQETSDYGLVSIEDNGDVKLRTDFDNLQSAYNKITLPTTSEDDLPDAVAAPDCKASLISSLYSGFQTNFTLPACPAQDMLKNGGGNKNIGQIIALNSTSSSVNIYDSNGNLIKNTTISISADDQINQPSGVITTDNSTTNDTGSSTTSKTSTSKAGSAVTTASTGLLASIFAFAFMFV